MKVGTVEFEIDSTKVIETDTELVIPGKIARECVLPYSQGKAYRPKEELQKSFFTFDGAWIVSGKHPDQMLVSKPSEISGRLTNVTWDDKEALVSGEVHLFKNRNTPQFIQDVKGGKLKDVSIGFIYAEDWTPGEFNKEKYDFVQRDIVINHVAVGVPKGRCPSPLCGLSVDMSEIKIGNDPWEETENSIRSGHGDASKAETCRTKVINEGLSLVVCKDKTGKWYDQSFIFKKDQGWTMQKAKEWFSKHNTDSLQLVTQLAVETILADAMTPEEIDAKIKNLEKDRDALKQQVSDYYAERQKKDVKLREKVDAVNRKRDQDVQAIYASGQSDSDKERLDQTYHKIDVLTQEIQAFTVAKVQGIVAGNETVVKDHEPSIEVSAPATSDLILKTEKLIADTSKDQRARHSHLK